MAEFGSFEDTVVVADQRTIQKACSSPSIIERLQRFLLTPLACIDTLLTLILANAMITKQALMVPPLDPLDGSSSG
jgi:hypothetical protein